MDALKLTLVILSLGLSACSLFSRHPNSGYHENAMEQSTGSPEYFYNDKKKAEVSEAKQELGYNNRELSENDTKRLQARLRLKRLEANLRSSQEKKQYYSYKPLMRNDFERIRFLSTPSMAGRERWAQNINLAARNTEFNPSVLKMIEQNDIAVGMNQQAVRESWGDPDGVDIAGKEIYGNQAWRYTKMISDDDGYKKETRIIYFEAGRVVGWDTL